MASPLVSSGLLAVGLLVASTAIPTNRLSANEIRPDSGENPANRTTAVHASAGDLLDAERAGLVTVRYIANDSRSAQVIVTNRTKKPLTLRLPAAFVGVPVLAQMGAQQAGAGFGAGGIGAQPQTVGGGGALGAGAGGGGFGGGGAAGGGAAFSIPPEKSRVLKVRTVCLEHGKSEPQPRHAYRLDRFDSFSSDPALQGVLEALGRGEISSQVAQAAAWHLSSGLSWEQIANERIDHVVDEDEPFFTPAEILAARQVVEVANHRAARPKSSSPTVTGPTE
jgi:hypothetical protein